MLSADNDALVSVPYGSCRVGPLCVIPDVLAEFGCDAVTVLSRAGLGPGILDHPEHSIDYTEAGRLLEICVTATGCVHFGLLIGQRCSLASLGLVGSVARTAADVATALRAIVRYQPVFDRGSTLALRTDGREATFAYGILAPAMLGADQAHALSLTIAFNTLKELCGGCWRPRCCPQPAATVVVHRERKYRTLLGGKVQPAGNGLPVTGGDGDVDDAVDRLVGQRAEGVLEVLARGLHGQQVRVGPARGLGVVEHFLGDGIDRHQCLFPR